VHLLSERATQAYELAREKVQHFLNAAQSREIIFVRGTTEAINLVAATYGRAHVGKGRRGAHHGDGASLEYRAWQLLCEEKGAILKVLPITDEGELRIDLLDRMLTGPHEDRGSQSRLELAGHHQPDQGRSWRIAHRRGIPVVVDGAQAVAHIPVDVQALDADFLRDVRPQAVRPDGHRRALRQGRASCGDASVPERRRHDQRGDVQEDHLQRAAEQIRGGHAEHRRCGGARGRDRLSGLAGFRSGARLRG
jgi:cysteine desulfurase/selenocysteine lyase